MTTPPNYMITGVDESKIGKRTAKEVAAWIGYLSVAELETLQNLAAEIPPDGVVVQIGAGAGTGSLGILEVTNDCVIFSIDIACGENPIDTSEHLRLIEAGYADTGHVIRVWGDSKIVGKRWPFLVDFLIVDGDHTAPGVRGDIEAWCHHVRPGGIMVFHDYGKNVWPDVKPAVDELVAGENTCLAHTKTLIAFRKGE